MTALAWDGTLLTALKGTAQRSRSIHGEGQHGRMGATAWDGLLKDRVQVREIGLAFAKAGNFGGSNEETSLFSRMLL